MLVGEQPGDQEDRQGHPFVGPAGRILAKALAAAGMDRSQIYVTNAVKHFKNVPRGKRRIHRRPTAGEIDACKWWLDLELKLVRPQVVVALGASAGRALLGHPVKIQKARGRPMPFGTERQLIVTVHPSLLLRIRDAVAKAEALERFIEDLRIANRLTSERGAPRGRRIGRRVSAGASARNAR
jgi:uracil-DNA glycosylase family protein